MRYKDRQDKYLPKTGPFWIMQAPVWAVPYMHLIVYLPREQLLVLQNHAVW